MATPIPYDAAGLDARLRAALAPGAVRLLVTGAAGSGKSTFLAGVPVAAGKRRIVLDFEDSMAYLDGPQDVYTPRMQQFAMTRFRFPALEDVAKVHRGIAAKADEVGALLIDNATLFQEAITLWLAGMACNPAAVRAMWKAFDADRALPVDTLIRKWTSQSDHAFWTAVKAIPKAIVLQCVKHQIHLVVSAEEGNKWVNFGKANAEVVGKKAKLWDSWRMYTDLIVFLARDVNTAGAPTAQLNPTEPKNRIQGMNPKFRGDWPGLVEELEAAKGRLYEEIPTAARADLPLVVDEPESSPAPEKAA